MSEKKTDDQAPTPDEPRTVFMPASPPSGEEKPDAAAPAAPDAPQGAGTSFAPRTDSQGIQVGDVLNHIFEVKRFLARGGMGEVFEGCNVNTDERVAIKVMLPSLAADEKVIQMFRKEARTLTRLQHEALVNYRVLAQEPQLGVLYIVTEYIDGVNLSDVLGERKFTPAELAGLLGRLASGLRAAHSLGAIHRDMSPDNVLLADGDIAKAKIIDFGIAKDLDASSATIVGDGFAGKLNYVAPEQLGDFGREVGTWTDVYSLALVILAVAGGKNVNLSGSLVDAIDKRRRGVDVSAAPEELRPVLEAMLKADPKERLRTMDDVLAMLGGSGVPIAPAAGGDAEPAKGMSKPFLIGGGLAAALAIGGVAWMAAGGGDGAGIVASRDPASVARAAIDSTLPSVPCTWLDIGAVDAGEGDIRVAMRGVAGNAEAAQQELGAALSGAGIANATVDFSDVAPITQAGCAALDTYRQVRAADARRLSASQPRYEMTRQATGPYAGREAANAVVNFEIGDRSLDFAVVGIEPSGAITTLLPSRAAFEQELANSVQGRPISDEGGDRYKLNIDLDHEGWSGIMLVTGKGPFEGEVIQPPIGARGPSWQQSFLSEAASKGWNTEMVWFESVNQEPGS